MKVTADHDQQDRQIEELDHQHQQVIPIEGDDDPPPAAPAAMTPRDDSRLVYERTPGWAEGWVRVTLEERPSGTKVVIEGHNYEYALNPTPLVLEGITRALRSITPDDLEAGRAVIGPVGWRALTVITRRVAAAAVAA